jgi:hypothetical protein
LHKVALTCQTCVEIAIRAEDHAIDAILDEIV